MQEWIFPFIKELHGNKESAYAKYMSDAIFKVPTPLMLDKIVTSLDDIYEQMAQLKNCLLYTSVRNMMLYCLDCHSKEGITGKRGTSRAAMMFLSNWLNEYGELGIMSVSSEYLSGRSVYISEESRINHALNHGGVAVVRLYLEEEHYVLMTGIQNENILLFDPYYWDKPFEQKDILMDDKHPREYNLSLIHIFPSNIIQGVGGLHP